MKRMLFNATHSEEMRVAIVDGQTLLDMDIETTGKEQKKSNIYKGVITRIEPSLEAAFVDYGSERHGFLPFKEISRSYFNKPEANPTKVRIQDVMNVGQEVVVQVEKDERGSKGAALTTFISLAGRYLVLMPKNPRGGGVSRRIEGEERAQLRDAMRDLEIPHGMSIIARTAGIGRSTEELDWDLKYLNQLWAAIDSASEQQNGSFLIYQDASLVIRAIRDYFSQDIGEILIDNQEIFDQAKQFMGHVMPHNVNRVKLYEEDTPLFSRFQIEHQIQSAYARQVTLPSGGSIVIDHTEAMVAIDVNSARATRGGDIEETARRTNIEAAHEVAKQLRLRDLGGLVVIDFIDMESQQNQREVEDQLKDALHHDRARIQIGKISRFGLLELSRQRLQSSLGESSHITCPRCSGTGNIRSIESTALHVIRIVQDEAMKEHTAAVHAQVPVEVASYLLNEKRNELYVIENRVKVSCVLIPNIHLETPHFTVKRIRTDEVGQLDSNTPSYSMAEAPADEYQIKNKTQEAAKPSAAVKGITPDQPAPEIKAQKKEGFFKRLLKAIFGAGEKNNKDDRRGGRRRDRFDNDRRRGR
ncbi:MAG: Rne/Rng family ribonuclease, partial [Burkholderiales bacterium]